MVWNSRKKRDKEIFSIVLGVMSTITLIGTGAVLALKCKNTDIKAIDSGKNLKKSMLTNILNK